MQLYKLCDLLLFFYVYIFAILLLLLLLPSARRLPDGIEI